MFHEVKIFSPEGKLKEVITPENLSKTYWKNFDLAEDQISLTSTGRNKVPRWVKEKLDVEFTESYDTSLTAP